MAPLITIKEIFDIILQPDKQRSSYHRQTQAEQLWRLSINCGQKLIHSLTDSYVDT